MVLITGNLPFNRIGRPHPGLCTARHSRTVYEILKRREGMTVTNETYEKVHNRFRAVFDAKWDRMELDNHDDLREKFAFHMADITPNLQRLAKAYESKMPG